MEKTTFGKTGFEVSRLGFGAGPIGYLSTEQTRVSDILNALLDAGVNLIDTASGYPGSEQAIAKAVGHRRDEFVIVSKCGNKLPDIEAPAWSPTLITQTVDRSLHNLGIDALDVMLLHSCDLKTLKAGDALAALVAARDAGKVRFIGYSGDNETAAYAAGLPDVAVIETSINIADQANINLVLPVTHNNDVAVLAKRPIANAAWKAKEAQPGLYAKYADPYHKRLAEMKLHPRDFGIVGSDDVAWPEFALRFTLSQPGVHTSIIGTTNPQNAKANLAAVAKGPLPHETLERVRKIFREAEASAGTRWAGMQ